MADEHGSGQDREKKNYYQCGLHLIDAPTTRLITIAKEKFGVRDASLSRSTSASKVSMSEARPVQ
jgi:hypothetical protein